MSKISQFQGTYRWLSNFAECKIILNQYTYNSVEHAYQSAKSNLKSWKEFCSTTNSPAIVKNTIKNLINHYYLKQVIHISKKEIHGMMLSGE